MFSLKPRIASLTAAPLSSSKQNSSALLRGISFCRSFDRSHSASSLHCPPTSSVRLTPRLCYFVLYRAVSLLLALPLHYAENALHNRRACTHRLIACLLLRALSPQTSVIKITNTTIYISHLLVCNTYYIRWQQREIEPSVYLTLNERLPNALFERKAG